MVSAAMAWVRAARPDLTPDRVVQAVKRSATDVVAPDGVNRPGWDPLTGFGVLNVGAALQIPADKLPIQDPLEPNDNLVWVDGTAFGKPSTPVWSGRHAGRASTACWTSRRTRSTSTGSSSRRQKSAKITVIPRFGDPSLEVFTLRGDLGQRRRRARGALARGRLQEDRAGDGPQPRRQASARTSSRSSPRAASRYQEREYTLRVR